MANLNLHLSNTIHDHDAHHRSNQIDPAIDRAMFALSPGLTNFVRPASPYEKKAYGLDDSVTAITEVSLVQRTPGVVGTHRLTWDPAKGTRPTTM